MEYIINDYLKIKVLEIVDIYVVWGLLIDECYFFLFINYQIFKYGDLML